jgi:hypothetical protein
LTGSGEVIEVPLHEHQVSLDYTRVELELQYTFASDWDVAIRIPWERKSQSAGIRIIEPVTEAERDSIERNAEIHHRSESYDGVADLMLLLRSRSYDRFRPGDALSFAIGSSIPTGRTEPDPYRLGDAGERHLHIQFGSGTFDPLIEASYQTRLDDRWALHGFVAARAPLYENSRGFRAPSEMSFALGPALRVHNFSVRGEIELFYQDFGEWNGERDPNTGIRSTAARLALQRRFGGSLAEVSLRLPMSQTTLGDGDAFDQGPTLSLSIQSLLGRRGTAGESSRAR